MTSIVVVDDDPALRRAVAETLTRAGYETHMVNGGREAMRHLEDDPADIVVTDLFMPEADGLEVISMLLRVSPSTCIVAMSGYENNENTDYLQAAKSFRAKSILRKPFRAAELLRAVAICSPEDI